MVSSLEIILVPTIMIILGYFLKRADILEAKDSNTLTKIVVNVSLPCLIFINIIDAKISADVAILPIAAFSLSIVCMIIAFIYCKSRNYSKVKTWTVMIATAMMNTGFLGYPITLGVFGNEGLLYAIFFDFSTAIIFVVFGMILVSLFGGNRNQVIKTGLSFVPIWALFLGLIVNFSHIELGYVITNILTYLGDSTVPLIMLSLGLTLEFTDIKEYLGDSLFIAVIRLLVAPVIMFIALTLIGYHSLGLKVAVLESGMSTAMNALVLAINYKLDVKLMSSSIFTNVIISLFTLTALITFLT
ncbi:MAG: AEC family transporter [Methanosphaera stadtmanae]|nr:AEC family transporter [Methanosphaera stadtmanae]